MIIELTDHERRVLAYLDQRGGACDRMAVVTDLAAPDSRIGRRRDANNSIGGGSNSGVPLIMGRWCQRLIRAGMVAQINDGAGYYRAHKITAAGRKALRRG